MLDWGESDDAWIRAVSKAGNFVTTEDYEIPQNENQSELIMNNRLGLFIVRCKGSRHSLKGELIVQNSAKLLRFINTDYCPFIAATMRSGVNGRRPRDRNWGQKYRKYLA